MKRICSGCGFPVKHAFVKNGRLVCGQSEMYKTVKRNGVWGLLEVRTPKCKF